MRKLRPLTAFILTGIFLLTASFPTAHASSRSDTYKALASNTMITADNSSQIPSPVNKVCEGVYVYTTPDGYDLKIIITAPGRIYLKNQYCSISVLSLPNKIEYARLNTYGTHLGMGEYLLRNQSWGYTFDPTSLGNLIGFIPDNGNTEREYNDTFECATDILTDTFYSGNLNSTYDVDIYKFTLSQNRAVTIQLNASLSLSYKVSIYAANYYNNTLCLLDTELSSSHNYSEQINIPAGTYYVKIYAPSSTYWQSSGYSSEYLFQVLTNPETDILREKETNDSISYATEIPINTEYKGNLSSRLDTDYYKLTLTTSYSGQIIMNLPSNSSPNLYEVRLLHVNDKKEEIVDDSFFTTSSTTNYGKDVRLKAGTYYIKILAGNNNYCSTADYGIRLQTVACTFASYLTLTGNRKEYTPGETVHLNAVVNPSNAVNKTIKWSSKNTQIATVDADGTLHCLSPGTVTLRAEITDDSSVYSELTISVKGSFNKPQTSENRFYMNSAVGDIYNLDFEYDDDVYIRYSSTNTAIAKVDYNGKVTFLSPGTVTLKAENDEILDLYIFTVTGEKSSDTGLKRIKVTAGKVTKSKSYDYVVSLSKYQSSTKISAVTRNKKAKYTINSQNVKNLKITVSRNHSKIVKIVVTAENGDKKTYKVKVVRK